MNKKYLGHNLHGYEIYSDQNLHIMYKIYQGRNLHNTFKIGRNL